MAAFGIERKSLTISITMVAYRSLRTLAEQKGLTPTKYVRALITKHLEETGMPIYYDANSLPSQAEGENPKRG